MVNGAEDIENSPEHPRILEVPWFCYGGTRITEYVEMIFSVVTNRSDELPGLEMLILRGSNCRYCNSLEKWLNVDRYKEDSGFICDMAPGTVLECNH